MQNMMMGSLDGNNDRVAFDVNLLERIIPRETTAVVRLPENSGAVIEVDKRKYALVGPSGHNGVKPYFLLLRNGYAFNVNDYRLLFGVKRLPGDLISGVDASGQEVRCPRWKPEEGEGPSVYENHSAELEGKLRAVNETLEELKDLKETFTKIKNGEFFESLAMELSGKIKEAAQEFIDFRNDFGQRIEPEIVRIAASDIPEASNQLEGINETLEESTMKIMDINEELMTLADESLSALETALSKKNAADSIGRRARKVLESQAAALKKMKSLSLNMMEPLSFQDLVGQRIQRIIHLVKSMEVRIEDMIISFGLKMRRHREDPEKTFEDLRKEVERYKSDLKGPQRQGEGMDQAQIDELLATL
jgi:chemotaxis regulatin CheY-phosphate phosphatase CheZ